MSSQPITMRRIKVSMLGPECTFHAIDPARIGRACDARAWQARRPLLRDDRLSLEHLGRMAREYDQISRGDHWPATRFVEWLRDEWRATAEGKITAKDRREVA